MEFEISNIGIVAAVAAGTVSFLSPCVLPLVPGYVSFIAGRNAQARNKAAVMLSSIAFVLGFSTVFVALGASATAVSRLLRAYSYEAGIVGGAMIVFFGLVTAGLIRIPWMQRDARYHGTLPGGGPGGAASAPCSARS